MHRTFAPALLLLLAGCSMEARPTPSQPSPEVAVDTVRVVREVNREEEPMSLESMVPTIYFDLDSNRIRNDQKPGLDRLAHVLSEHRELRARLEGHASRDGSEAYNKALSQRRAYAVFHYLLARGVLDEQLTLRAYGEAFPERSDESEAAAELNRRVDIYFQVR